MSNLIVSNLPSAFLAVITVLSCISLSKKNSSTTINSGIENLDTQIKKTDDEIEIIQKQKQAEEEKKLKYEVVLDDENNDDVTSTDSLTTNYYTTLNLILVVILLCILLSYMPSSILTDKVGYFTLFAILFVIFGYVIYQIVQCYKIPQTFLFFKINVTLCFFVILISLLCYIDVGKSILLDEKNNNFSNNIQTLLNNLPSFKIL